MQVAKGRICAFADLVTWSEPASGRISACMVCMVASDHATKPAGIYACSNLTRFARFIKNYRKILKFEWDHNKEWVYANGRRQQHHVEDLVVNLVGKVGKVLRFDSNRNFSNHSRTATFSNLSLLFAWNGIRNQEKEEGPSTVIEITGYIQLFQSCSKEISNCLLYIGVVLYSVVPKSRYKAGNMVSELGS